MQIPFLFQDVEQRLRAEQAARNRAENEAAAIKRELDAIMQVENIRIEARLFSAQCVQCALFASCLG